MPSPYVVSYDQLFAITPSDSGPVIGPTQADGRPATSANGIHALTTGNIVVRLRNDRSRAAVTLPVIAGTFYPYAVAYMYTTSTATIAGVL